MLILTNNDVKVYNLSCGKSIPEWLDERKRRLLMKKDPELRHNITLIQDFDMPQLSSCLCVTPDGQYVMVAGMYKPRLRCFELSEMSMKFDRCMDAEVVRMQMLSEDFSKVVMLQADRHIEFHNQSGFYHRLRIPRFGRDLAYDPPYCDLYVVGASSEVYRLNLEVGQFLEPYKTKSSGINCCAVNANNYLLAVGTEQTQVVCFDPRTKSQVGLLDVAESLISMSKNLTSCGVSKVVFAGVHHMAVGLDSGKVLLYDIRSCRPYMSKDHQYGLPIKNITFLDNGDHVLSADQRAVKIWEKQSGKGFTSIECEANINDVAVYPSSGIIFTANESERMGAYFIPSLGPAPRWCSVLDSVTEELEESADNPVYDDYKFVTRQELESMGLSHLVGSNMLRAYMHGFFVDVRLYQQAKAISDPFAYEDYKNKRIKQKIDEDRVSRIKLAKLPSINKELAEKLLATKNSSRTVQDYKNPTGDSRFQKLFSDPNFQIDTDSEAYKLVHHPRAKMAQKKQVIEEQSDEDEVGNDSTRSSDDENEKSNADTGSEVESMEPKKHNVLEKIRLKPQTRVVSMDRFELPTLQANGAPRRLTTYQNAALGDLVRNDERENPSKVQITPSGQRSLTFTLPKSDREREEESRVKDHQQERKKLRRSAASVYNPQSGGGFRSSGDSRGGSHGGRGGSRGGRGGFRGGRGGSRGGRGGSRGGRGGSRGGRGGSRGGRGGSRGGLGEGF